MRASATSPMFRATQGYGWNHIFLRDSESKEIWCDMTCLRITQYKDEQARRDARSRYWTKRALEGAKQDVREILEVILPGRITEKEMLDVVKRKSRPN